MKFENKKLIIFDFDGTLIDSVPDLTDSVNYMLEKLQKETFELEVVRTWIGNGASTLVKRALCGDVVVDENSFTNEYYEKAMSLFLEYYSKNTANKTFLYPNVKETLKDLKKKDYIFAIATNKPDEFIKPILDKFEITSLFDIYLGANSVERKKPDPMMLLKICEELKIAVKHSVMIGDSKNDIISAKNANMESIALTYGYNYDEDIRIHEPTIVCDEFKELLEVL